MMATAMTTSEGRLPVVLFWFRRDLRLDDNIGLEAALASGWPVVPVFVYDTDLLSKLEEAADRRVDWLHQCLSVLQTAFVDIGTSLVVYNGRVNEAFEGWLSRFDVKAVYTNRDYEPAALRRDEAVRQLLLAAGVPLHTFKDQVVAEPHEVLKVDGSPYTVFTPYAKAWKTVVARITSERSRKASLTPTEWMTGFCPLAPETLPSLEALGFKPTGVVYAPPVIDEARIAAYHQWRDMPSVEGTTRLGVHLRFGTVSVRRLVGLALRLNETWLNELIWREFFMSILYHFPKVEHGAFKPAYDAIAWCDDEAAFQRWCEGRTGFPLVDAGMRELNATGWMHNRVRMVVAGFLVKDLLIDWRWGETYFGNRLMDFDLAANNGNWQWAAGTGCDAVPYFRVFNPEQQRLRWDPQGLYVKRWVPEWGTSDYPAPMVDHAQARERALQVYKAALALR